MMNALGFRRVLIILSLVLGNIMLLAVVYLYLQPQEVVQAANLQRLNGEVSGLRSDVARMQIEYDQLQYQTVVFKKLEADGFFKDQSRRQAEDVFNEIQRKSGVSVAIAKIDAGRIEENEEAKKAGYKILKSNMELKIEAIDDVDIYHYLFLIERYFPGDVAIESLNIKREAGVTGTILRAIASGTNPALVKANIRMMWRTMIPENQVIGGESKQ